MGKISRLQKFNVIVYNLTNTLWFNKIMIQQNHPDISCWYFNLWSVTSFATASCRFLAYSSCKALKIFSGFLDLIVVKIGSWLAIAFLAPHWFRSSLGPYVVSLKKVWKPLIPRKKESGVFTKIWFFTLSSYVKTLIKLLFLILKWKMWNSCPWETKGK